MVQQIQIQNFKMCCFPTFEILKALQNMDVLRKPRFENTGEILFGHSTFITIEVYFLEIADILNFAFSLLYLTHVTFYAVLE